MPDSVDPSVPWSIPPLLAVTSESRDRETQITLVGELDLSSAALLDAAVRAAAERPDTARVALNLAELTFMDSTGLQALLNARLRLAGLGIALVLRDPSRVRKVLTIAGVEDYFSIE